MDSERYDLYKRLREKGTSESEIERVYNQLRSKGYGESDARERIQRAVRRVQDENRHARQESRQPDSPHAARRHIREEKRSALRSSSGEGTNDSGETAASAQPYAGGTTPGRSAESSSHGPAGESGTFQRYHRRPSPAFRRRINAWAFKERLLITGIRERLYDWLSLFAPHINDYANDRLISRLAGSVRFDAQNPFDFSLYETLWALKASAGLLLAEQSSVMLPCSPETRPPNNDVVVTLRRREPFLVAFHSRFLGITQEEINALLFFRESMAAGRRVAAAELVDTARLVYRLQLSTEGVTEASLRDLLKVNQDVLLAHGGIATGEIERARELLLSARETLADFARELYPVVLRALGTFYDYYDRSAERHGRLMALCGLGEDDLLSLSSFRNQQIREKEQELLGSQREEVKQLETEKEATLQERYSGILGILDALFPEAGWDRIEQMPYFLPYFDYRVFSTQLPFPQRNPDIQAIARHDPLQIVMVVHRLLDNLLSSLSTANLENVLSKDDLADRIDRITQMWRSCYSEVFEPYVKAVTELRRATEEAGTSNAAYVRSLQEQINQIRNRCIHDYGHTVLVSSAADAAPLSDAVNELVELLEEVGAELNVELVQRDDPIGRRIYRQLGNYPIIDYEAHANPSSPDHKPVIRQLKRYVEAKYHNRVRDIPKLSQLFYLDVFRALVDFYAFLLTDEDSPARAAGEDIPIAGEEEAARWHREQNTRQRDTLELVRARLKEEQDAGLRDALTGLRNKEFYLHRLPKLYEKLQAKQQAVSLMLIDIDHFKWVNDSFGHQKGDEVLADIGQSVADALRKGHDIPIRYGGEELLVLVQADAHTALLLAERLRYAQGKRVSDHELYDTIRELAEQRGEPCATLSIGTYECARGEPLETGLAEADKALYKAKEHRNRAVLIRKSGAESGETQFLSYQEYADSLQEQKNTDAASATSASNST